MPRSIVTLTTDFGLADHFTGVLKGVILGICPQAQIVDISHQISPFEITEAAFVVSEAYRHFPKKTVHLVVVDPGVGSARRPILMEAAGQYFVAPDNGVLAMIYGREKHRVRAITAERYFRKPVSQTFHGRDIFAPVAAHLAKGVAASRFGRLVSDYLRLAFEKPQRTGKRYWTGTVLKIDRFGNLISNYHVDDFPDIGARTFELAAGPHRIQRLARSYAECAPGEPFLIVGSSGYYEVSVNQGHAAKLLGFGVGAPLDLTLY